MTPSAITSIEPTPSEVEVLTPIENPCQPLQAADKGECHASEDNIDFELEGDDPKLEDDDSDSEEELEYSYLPRGKQIPKTSGQGGKKGGEATRPSKDKDKKTGGDKKAEEKKKDGKK